MKTNFLMKCCVAMIATIMCGSTIVGQLPVPAGTVIPPTLMPTPSQTTEPSFRRGPSPYYQPSPTRSIPAPNVRRSGWRTVDPAVARATNESNQKISEAIKGIKESESDGEKSKFKSEIQTELESQYDVYLAQNEKPLKDLEFRLAQLRADFEARKQAKDDLVKLRLDTIWYNALGLGWPGGSGGPELFRALGSTPPNLNVPRYPPTLRTPTRPTIGVYTEPSFPTSNSTFAEPAVPPRPTEVRAPNENK